MLTDIGICGERGRSRGIVKKDALPGAQDMIEDRLRQHRRAHRHIAQLQPGRVAGGQRLRRYPFFAAVRQNQHASFGARLFDCCTHDHLDQPVEHDVARGGLRHLDHRREVEVFDWR